MTLASATDLLDRAAYSGIAVGAFNVVLLEHAEAFVAAADSAELPVVLQISENCVRYHDGLAPLTQATLCLARAATQPVCVQLDHAVTRVLVQEAADLGIPAVMFDGSLLDYEANLAETAEVACLCHSRHISVEAELGVVGGKGGVHAPGARTDPAEAADFVAATGVDALAVAVGTEHRMTARDAVIDFALIERLRAAVGCPLVLHGSSGVSDKDLSRAVRAGITKVNISTHLNSIFTAALREQLVLHPKNLDPREYVRKGREAVSSEAERLLNLLAGRLAWQQSQRSRGRFAPASF
jgi:ketose-bisphosphate aldolase